jgi:hypothetical protein
MVENLREKYLGDCFSHALPFLPGEIESLDKVFGMPVNGQRPALSPAYFVFGTPHYIRKVGAYFLLSQGKRLDYTHLTLHEMLARYFGRSNDEVKNSSDFLDLVSPVLILHRSKGDHHNILFQSFISGSIVQRGIRGQDLSTICLCEVAPEDTVLEFLKEYGVMTHLQNRKDDEPFYRNKKKIMSRKGLGAEYFVDPGEISTGTQPVGSFKIRTSDPV